METSVNRNLTSPWIALYSQISSSAISTEQNTTPVVSPSPQRQTIIYRSTIGESLSSSEQLIQLNLLALPRLSGINVRVVEHFCFFPTGSAAQTSSEQNYSRTILEITWTTGSAGRRRGGCPSSTWKTSFLLPAVLWLHRGLLLRSMVPRQGTWMTQQYLWRFQNPIAVKHNLFGTTFVETLNITTVTPSVLLPIFPRRELSFFHHTRLLQDPRISASSSGDSEQNVVSFGPNTSGLQQNSYLTTLKTARRMIYKSRESQVDQR